MSIDHTTLLFFDASCLIAAAGSPTGGSGFLLSLCARSLLRGAVSQVVLLEAERNIAAKLSLQALNRYHHLLQTMPLVVAALPPLSSQESWLQMVNAKDVHVLAAALAIDASYLLTLDQQLAVEVNQIGLSLHALTPADFIRLILPSHVDYPSLRS
jgi:predicted nucleic acid-binding protein